MLSENTARTSGNTKMPDALGDLSRFSQRPAIVDILAYLLLMQAGSVWVSFLLAQYYGYFGRVALMPNTSMPIWLQWKVMGGSAVVALFVAIGLLRAQRWGRLGYVITTLSFGLLYLGTSLRVSELFQMHTFFGALLFFAFSYLLYRTDAKRYFAPSASPRPNSSARRHLGACLYVLAAIFAYWSLNAIATGLADFYPRAVGRDKLAFVALPIICAAEWIGRTPGALSRLGALATAFGVFMLQMFLLRYAVLYNAQTIRSIGQLGNWAVGTSGVGLLLLYLAHKGGAAN
jgi:hypothetical protein